MDNHPRSSRLFLFFIVVVVGEEEDDYRQMIRETYTLPDKIHETYIVE